MPATRNARGRVCWLILCCAVIGITGAAQPKPQPVGKLDVERKWEFEAGEAKALDLQEQPGAQTLTVEFASAKCPVSVYVFKEEDAKGDDALFDADPKKAIAGATATAGIIRAEVSAKTATRVILRGVMVKSTVNVKLANQLAAGTKDDRIKKLEDENAALKKELADAKQQLAELKKRLEKK